jgi:Trp operon repressor
MAVIAQCPSCRTLVAVDRIVVDGDRAGFRCSSCLAVGWLPVERVHATALPALPIVSDVLPLPALPALPAPSTAIVPAAPVAIVPSVASSFDDDVLQRITAKLAAPAAGQQQLAERFSKLLSQWHNETEHKQLLKAAAASDELAFVGSRYRAVLDVVRDEPRARAAQQELITLAMATMSTNRSLTTTEEPQGNNTFKVVLAVVLVLVGTLGFGLGIKKMLGSIDKITAIE